MSFASTAAILEALQTRIEALTPDTQVNEDDTFRVLVGESGEMQRGSRAVFITCTPARRKLSGGQTCHDWQTTVEIEIQYRNIPAEPGQRGVYGRAVADAEAILVDLYTWSTTTSGILSMTPDLGDLSDDGQGVLVSIRSIELMYRRT